MATVIVTVWVPAALVWLEISSSDWAAVAVAFGIIGEAVLLYLTGADAYAARSVRGEVWEQVQRLNKNATGHLALILECFSRRHRRPGRVRTRADVYKQELRNLQQHLLSHAIDVIVAQIGDEGLAEQLSANWTLRGTDEHQSEFRTVLYDRNMPDRKPREGNWKPIAKGLPGASVAFVDAAVSLVEDTWHSDLREFFPTSPRYRSILSIPVDCEGTVAGVLNVDATEPGLLNTAHQYLVLDIAYLIGLCEVLLQEKGP